MRASIVIGLVVLIMTTMCRAAPWVVMHRAPDSSNDKRQDYNTSLIKLALTKTLVPGETLELKPIPPMNSARARFALNTNLYPNLILELSYEDEMKEHNNIDYAPFPIDLGALSYRTCFVSPEFEQSGKKINSLANLKAQVFAVGVGWPEAVLLKDNQLNVIEISAYDNIFKMLSASRFDLFCRGTSEVLNEYRTFNTELKLHHNKTFAIHYPLPRFFFVHASNQALKKRLEKGLEMAFADGTLQSLWRERFYESIKFADIKKRKILELENKRIKNIDKSYEKYLMPLSNY